MNEVNDDPKLVADQLGHTLDVNQNVYPKKSVARRKKSGRCDGNILHLVKKPPKSEFWSILEQELKAGCLNC